MLKISVQFFFRKTGEKFRLRASVNFTDAVDQFPFAHSDILQNFLAAPPNLSSIDRLDFFSLADCPPAKLTPYNTSYYIKGSAGLRPQHIAQPNCQHAVVVSMSNKIPLADSKPKQKKSGLFFIFLLYIAPDNRPGQT